MNPPAAIDALFNRIARREALPAGPVVDFDTALPPLEFQVEAKIPQENQFPLSSSRRKLKLSFTPWGYSILASKPTQYTGALGLRPRSALRRLR